MKDLCADNIQQVIYHPYRTARVEPIKFSVWDEHVAWMIQSALYRIVGQQGQNHCVYEVTWKDVQGRTRRCLPGACGYVAINVTDDVIHFGFKVRPFERRIRNQLRPQLYSCTDDFFRAQEMSYIRQELARKKWKEVYGS